MTTRETAENIVEHTNKMADEIAERVFNTAVVANLSSITQRNELKRVIFQVARSVLLEYLLGEYRP